ncbi:MAG TPA: hypothetical protein PKI19_03445 [Elusimicrobiales bacterium]|nr:hypothetical protein [Elusimicrobiales bacterium]
MKNTLLLLTLCCLSLSGCGMLKQKAAGHYLAKARAAALKANPAPAELEAAFALVEKASGYAPGAAQPVAALEELAEASEKKGFPKGRELQSVILRKMIAREPAYWTAREALVNFLAERGDLAGLADEALAAGKLAEDKEPHKHYCALLVQLAATASAVPWLEAEAYLGLNKTPDAFFEKAGLYSSAAARVADLKAEVEKLAAADAALRSAAPGQLVSAAEVAGADALRDEEDIAKAADFNAKAGSDPAFKKAVAMTIQGNAALVKKEYAAARAFYQGALAQYPALTDARRQLAEADFQEGVSLAAVGGGGKAADQLLGKAYAGVNAVLAEAAAAGNCIPFIKRDKFLGETYAMKAAAISAMRAVKGKKFKKTAKLEAEFKASLEAALKYSPEGRLARELNERYIKEGF